MHMWWKRGWLIGGYVGLGIASAVLAFCIGLHFSESARVAARGFAHHILPSIPNVDLPVSPVYTSGTTDRAFFDRAYERAGATVPAKSSSAIVAHHLLTAPAIANVFASLGTGEKGPIVILSPNHFSAGKSPAQISFGTWETPYGELATDTRVVMRLLEEVPFLMVEESTFQGEHGISAITPFAKKSFPNGTLVPLVLHESLTNEQATKLAEALFAIAPNARVFASIDMSHNLPQYDARFHDAITLKEIETGGACADASCDIDLEIDANRVLQTLFAWNQLQGTETFVLTEHDASLDIAPNKDAWIENTSHILGYFQKGSAQKASYASFQVVGDIMLDRGVRAFIDENGVEYPWQNMTRFLTGTHRTIGNLEGTIGEEPAVHTPHDPPYDFVFDRLAARELVDRFDAVSLANNHTRDFGSMGEAETRQQLDEWGLPWFGSWSAPIQPWSTTIDGTTFTWIGYHQFYPAVEELQEAIRAAKTRGEFVIVFPHWGTEYRVEPDSNQRALAQIMVDAGADLIIGGHPHVPQGISIIDGVPVVWSLGNFIFDQRLPETFVASTLGVIVTDTDITLSILPVYTKDGQPTPVTDEVARKLFAHLAAHSDVDLAEQVKTGILHIQRPI